MSDVRKNIDQLLTKWSFSSKNLPNEDLMIEVKPKNGEDGNTRTKMSVLSAIVFFPLTRCKNIRRWDSSCLVICMLNVAIWASDRKRIFDSYTEVQIWGPCFPSFNSLFQRFWTINFMRQECSTRRIFFGLSSARRKQSKKLDGRIHGKSYREMWIWTRSYVIED